MKDDKEFMGRYIFGLHAEFFRDQDKADPNWFRLWEELKPEEKELYAFVGTAAFNYFRNTEGSEALSKQLAELNLKFEDFRAAVQKEWKASGGMQNPTAMAELVKGSK